MFIQANNFIIYLIIYLCMQLSAFNNNICIIYYYII